MSTGGPVDDQRCALLGPTALVVQALLGVLVIVSLVFKRYHERPRRKWRIWLFDVSKQVVGQVTVHFVNVFLASFIGRNLSENPCVLYFLHIILDTTLGVGLLYIFLHLITYLITRYLHWDGFQSGQYGDPPAFSYWIRQATVYVASLLTMKTIIVSILSISPWLFTAAAWLLSWTVSHPRLQVIFVMGITPIIFNILQFWLIDSIVKASVAVAGTPAADPPDIEPLITRPPEDEEATGESSAVSITVGDLKSSEPGTPRTGLIRKPSYPPPSPTTSPSAILDEEL